MLLWCYYCGVLHMCSYESVQIQQLKGDFTEGLFVLPDTWSKRSDLHTHPGPVSSSDKKSMPLSLVIFSVSASPSFISKWLYINASCHVWPTSAGHSVWHTWVRDRGLGEDGRSECKQSLSPIFHWGSGTLCVCVRLRPQDKNVFDIVCNCVMFTLLVSEGACISKQAFDCQLWWGEGFLFGIHWETARSLDTGLRDGTKRRISFSAQLHYIWKYGEKKSNEILFFQALWTFRLSIFFNLMFLLHCKSEGNVFHSTTFIRQLDSSCL